MPTAFAMVLRREVVDIFAKLGHDGSEIIFPQLEDPERRRSFTLHEMIFASDYFGYDVIPIVPSGPYSPVPGINPRIMSVRGGHDWLHGKLRDHEGVIVGVGNVSGKMHAVAWDRNMCFDPNGTVHQLHEMVPLEFYIVKQH